MPRISVLCTCKFSHEWTFSLALGGCVQRIRLIAGGLVLGSFLKLEFLYGLYAEFLIYIVRLLILL